MNLAVMQPYLFPYLGYFQLIYASDLFLIYDDVTYIKQGYINRNCVLSENGVIRFTVPVPGASSNKFISDLMFSDDMTKVLKTVEQSYARAPFYEAVFPLVQEILEYQDRSIASVCQASYQAIFSYLGLEKNIRRTSKIDYDRSASPRARLVALCHKFRADCYINTPGGRSLYTKKDFAEHGVQLKFIHSLPVYYRQGKDEFVPNLSIIDALMNCSIEEILKLLNNYELVE